MSDIVVEGRWVGGLRFEIAGKAGRPVLLDGDGAAGVSPVEAVAVALAGCMAADVVDILAKMRVPLDALAVRVEGDRRAEPPRRYTAMRLDFRAEGVPASDTGKLQRAVDLSRDTYCSVLHTLDPALDVTFRVETV